MRPVAQSTWGALAGMASAALFGASAPMAKLLLADLGPFVLAGLLYLGAGVGLTVARLARRGPPETALQRADLLPLAGVVGCGGLLGPLLLMIGLRHLSGVSASLLLNLEGLFTLAIAIVIFREHVTWRAAGAAVAILLGALSLGYRPGPFGADAAGMLAVAGACLCWGIDNNLTQRLSLRDPFTIIQIKTLVAGACNLGIGLAIHEHLALDARVLAAAAAVGLLGYGASIVLDFYALRLLGAAREAAFFATAPFVGAAVAVPLLGEPLRLVDGLAGGLMAVGVVLLLRERHGHAHTHDPLAHDHLHQHDEHHRHDHGPGQDAIGPHAHEHRHDPITHEHPHVPDLHHRHRH